MMSKKKGPSFAMPTRAASLDEWVAGAPAALVPPAPPAMPEAAAEPPAKPARLTIDLPVNLHRQFKVAAARNGVGMVDVVREAIEAWVQKHS